MRLRFNILASVLLISAFQATTAQVTFIDQTNSLIGQVTSSYYPVGISDLNGDFLDDIIILDSGNYMWRAIQNSGQAFTLDSLAKVSSKAQWSLCIGDLEYDGVNDIIMGGYNDSIKLFVEDGFSNYNVTYINDVFFIQGSNIVDINNDGWSDIFACNDLGQNKPYRNSGAINFVLDTSLITTTSDHGNYASIWSDHDNDGDLDVYISKCYSSAPLPNDPRRINLFYQNDGNNNFVELADSLGIADGSQSWAAEFADIENDGDMDLFVLNHKGSNKLFENLGNGQYSDIYTNTGIVVDSMKFNFQLTMSDFDNDGYVDILMGGAQYGLYLNNGDKTFSKAINPFPSSDTLHSFAVGDLNHDGFRDIYGVHSPLLLAPDTFTKPDRLYINAGNSNGFLVVNLVGTTANTNGIGSRLELYGGWGIQIRDVRSGEGYGTMNSLSRHFGLGQNDFIDSLIVRWPSGIVDVVLNPQVNQAILVTEGIGVGMQEQSRPSVSLSPNPVSEYVELEFPFLNPWDVRIIDIQGRIIYEAHSSSAIRMRVDLSRMGSGMYFYEVRAKSKLYASGKMIIE